MKSNISEIIKVFFVRFSQLFRSPEKIEAFEAIMALAISHAYGCYNPKQWADYLGISHQKIQQKSAATQSRAKLTIAVDDSVIDRARKRLRCTQNWYSGRWKKVVRID